MLFSRALSSSLFPRPLGHLRGSHTSPDSPWRLTRLGSPSRWATGSWTSSSIGLHRGADAGVLEHGALPTSCVPAPRQPVPGRVTLSQTGAPAALTGLELLQAGYRHLWDERRCGLWDLILNNSPNVFFHRFLGFLSCGESPGHGPCGLISLQKSLLSELRSNPRIAQAKTSGSFCTTPVGDGATVLPHASCLFCKDALDEFLRKRRARKNCSFQSDSRVIVG